MNYLIIEKTHDGRNFVHLGPKPWNQRIFQSVISDDFDLDFKVPISNDTNQPIIINEKIRIIPILDDLGITAPLNSKIQKVIGPYYEYNFEETFAKIYFNVVDKLIEEVKDELKLIISSNRYRYEILGITVRIQNQNVTALTTREDRGLYLQAYQLGKDGISWKFGNTFLTVSNEDLGIIVNAIADHVQSVFDWEQQKVQEIDNATSLESLDLISLISDNPLWEQNLG